MNLAIVTNPVVAIAWPKVLISKGPVATVDTASASLDAQGNITFSWADNSGNGTAKKNDRAILVAYFPESQQAFFSISDAERMDEMSILETGVAKGVAHTWLGFLTADEANAANSVYTGELVI